MPDPEVKSGAIRAKAAAARVPTPRANSGTVREEFSFEVVATSLEAPHRGPGKGM